jgi:hypothetical protein
LQPRALEILLETGESSDIAVQFLSEQLGFEDSKKHQYVCQNRSSVLSKEPLNVMDVDHELTGKAFRFSAIIDLFADPLNH